jgi:sec-independent protein translocase protein TatA|tara:strand:+ start:326 stop:592 length:267 start_codon:yes stop_codon:yes gene_type:complete
MTNHFHLAFSPGMPEILLVLAVILIFFGAKKLPELAKGMGQGIKEFKKATRDVNHELERAIDDQPTHSPPPSQQITEQSAGNETKKDT